MHKRKFLCFFNSLAKANGDDFKHTYLFAETAADKKYGSSLKRFVFYFSDATAQKK